MVPESSGGQRDTQVDLFASCESAHLSVYFSIYRKDRSVDGSMLWFRSGSSRGSMRFHLLNLFCINMHGNQGLNSVTDYDVSKTKSFVGSFTKYLWFLFRVGNLSLAALKVHRSAIATIVDPLSQTLLRQLHMVRRFMEALFLSRPLCKIVTFTWRMRSCSRFRQTQVL